ncbi:DUF928 domain-containing protein [Leptolyngbya sp. DQ-M1]|uniref:DUF928 domain-containing protein n=1 Tax=Leptolyngbya sp. DQ-M1 TaxID=2933920 RepID=UPI0032992981
MTFLASMKTASAALGVVLIGTVTIAQFSNAQQRINFSPPTPPDPGTPSDRGQAGGSRGPCDDVYTGLAALVPSPHANVPADRWGLTVSDRPTVWFNVPTGITAGTLAEWRLRDATGKTRYKTSSRLPKTNPGVIGFSIPASVPLAIATYQWDLALYCDSVGNSASDPNSNTFDRPLVRKGRIQRVATPPALQQELKQAKTPLDRAKLYAKYGIWYDALTALGVQIQASQNNQVVLAAWRDLLRQQRLEGKTSATVTPCCQP